MLRKVLTENQTASARVWVCPHECTPPHVCWRYCVRLTSEESQSGGLRNNVASIVLTMERWI